MPSTKGDCVMKKIFLASCMLAASVFAAPQAAANANAAPAAAPTAAAPAAAPAKPAPAAAPAKDAKAAPAAEAAKPAAAPAAAPAAPAKDAKAEPAKPAAAPAAAPATAPAKDAKAEPAKPAAQAAAPAAAPADTTKAAPAEEAKPAEAAAAPVAAPADSAKAEPAAEVAATDTAKAAPTEAEIAANTDEQGFISAPEPQDQPKKKKRRKKKKLVENAVISTDKAEFGILADFELSAEKVFWTSEEDNNNDNLETWQGEANFAILAEGENFKGKLALAFYPGDLRDENFGGKDAKQEALRNNENGTLDDYYSLDEAWAYQNTDMFSFKVGRWDNTDKNGDYFGGYVDGYLAGFLSTQKPENQLQFGLSPTDNLDFTLAFISKAVNLDNGDLRAAFNFHGLEGLNDLKIQLAYRSNLFDKVYDTDSKVKHNTSLKANLPLIKNAVSVFAEAALLDISSDDDMVIPVTGGFLFQTKVVDRIILEAEYIGDRQEHAAYWGIKDPKHIKDVLGALYLEKAFTDRFSLSAGFHSFGCTKDFTLSGNLIGRIN